MRDMIFEFLNYPVFSTILIAVITGVFSLLALKIQGKQNKIMRELDKYNIFIENQKQIRQRLILAEKRRDGIIEQMIMVSMRVNIQLLGLLETVDSVITKDLRDTSSELEAMHKKVSEEIDIISREYDIISDLNQKIQEEVDARTKSRVLSIIKPK